MMIEPTKENLAESRKWRHRMVGLYHRGRLSKQQIQQLNKIPNWDWEHKSFADKKKELLKLAKSGAPKPNHTTSLGQALNNIRYSKNHLNFIRKIQKLRPDWFENSADKNKKKLLKLAKSGAPKPNHTTSLGQALVRYTLSSVLIYDAVFTKRIQKLRPDWFENGVDKNKKKLLKLAKSGAPKPKNGSKLNDALRWYTNPNKSGYDATFNKKIRNLCPDWFDTITSKIKKKLLALAKSGAPKPEHKSTMGQAFMRYIHIRHRNAYDADFIKKIQKLRPDWFDTITSKIKEKLLALAKNKAQKPVQKTGLGQALKAYTSPGYRYDAVFDKKIRALHPDWFINSISKKKELLVLAKSGALKPKQSTNKKLSHALANYMKTDTVFSKEVRALRPDWFENSADKNKKKLLKLAKSGAPKPKWNSRLGKSLRRYTTSGNCYSGIFVKKIRTLRPDWFQVA